MNSEFAIHQRPIGPGHPVYIVAELSANHGQNFDQAAQIIQAAQKAGADAIKIQTYTPDTLTIPSNTDYFKIHGGTLWDGKTLYDLYAEAYTPWDWQPKLQKIALDLGLHFFSTPFDPSAVQFLESLHLPAYKVASFELVDLPLIRQIAATRKPIILSTGMATLDEINEALNTARQAGATQIALLKCTSGYPALPEEMNLRTIPSWITQFQIPIGLSDHTLGPTVPTAAVALGASIVEKHLTLSRSFPGPDSAFSLEPDEFKAMVDAIRTTEKALGAANYSISPNENKSRLFRRSLFIVAPVQAGEPLTTANVRSIRPSHGLHPRYLDSVLGRKAATDLPAGTPLQWHHLA